MTPSAFPPYSTPPAATVDEWLFDWDPTPGIVSVWADRTGQALVWQRLDGQIRCRHERFRPWLFAATLDDLAHLGNALRPADSLAVTRAAITYQLLAGAAVGTYRYLLSAADGRTIEGAILTGANRRLCGAVAPGPCRSHPNGTTPLRRPPRHPRYRPHLWLMRLNAVTGYHRDQDSSRYQSSLISRDHPGGNVVNLTA